MPSTRPNIAVVGQAQSWKPAFIGVAVMALFSSMLWTGVTLPT